MKKSNVERILDKIEGEIETAEKYTQQVEGTYMKGYFDGKGVGLNDLKTWIQENIVDGKTEV